MYKPSRAATLLAGASLALTGLVASPADATDDARPARSAVDWLVANGMKTSPNAGLAGDTALAMAEIDATGYAAAIDEVAAYVVGKVDDTTKGPALAKAAVVAQVAGSPDAAAIVTRLEGKVTDGKLADVSEFDGVIAQSFAVRALAQGGSLETPEALAFLSKQQCSDGGFPAPADDAGCTTGEGTDVDSSAIALINLAETDLGTVMLTTGRDYLRKSQDAAGSWSSWGTPNANTTGVAAWALGESAESRKAGTWLRSLQLMDAPGCDRYRGVETVPDPQGAVVWSEKDRDDAAADGLDGGALTGAKYATPQAAPALRWAAASDKPQSLNGPTSYVRAGSKVTVRASGMAVNDNYCFTGLGTPRPGLSDGSSVAFSLTLPARTRNHAVRLTDTVGRSTSAVVKALGAKTFTVSKSAARVKRGRYVRITVRGMAPRERVKVFYKGARIRNTSATAKGTYTTRFRVGSSTGLKTIVVKGQFPDIRKARAALRVVR